MRAEVVCKMASFLWDIWRKVSPRCAVVGPQEEKSPGPVSGVNCRHEHLDMVNLRDFAGDDREKISREGGRGT
jgi:hypothetical protein